MVGDAYVLDGMQSWTVVISVRIMVLVRIAPALAVAARRKRERMLWPLNFIATVCEPELNECV